jgi:hypothetical protein
MTRAQRINARQDKIYFAAWLNRIDAIVTYDVRRQQPVSEWRELFDAGECERDAITIALYGAE